MVLEIILQTILWGALYAPQFQYGKKQRAQGGLKLQW